MTSVLKRQKNQHAEDPITHEVSRLAQDFIELRYEGLLHLGRDGRDHGVQNR